MKVTLVDLQDTLEKGTLVTRQHGIAKVLPLKITNKLVLEAISGYNLDHMEDPKYW